MILKTLANTTPYTYNSGLRTKIKTDILPPIPKVEESTICYCNLECEYMMNVFAKVGGEDYENDKFSFLYRKMQSTDSIVIKLYKDLQEVATITDDTYGIYTNGFTLQPLYVGFVLDFEKVFDAFGGGIYHIKTTTTILGTTSTLESFPFRLYPYSDLIADKTVVVKISQNGNIVGGEFDYTGLNWTWQFRIVGKLTKENPDLVQDFYISKGDKKEQIKDKISRNWELKTALLPSRIVNFLLEEGLLSEDIFITDYNILNNDIYRNVHLYPKGSNLDNKARNKRSIVKMQFNDKYDNLIKRNY